MGGKKNKKKNPHSGGIPSVRISQCMIVKNEESNIERALNWAKGTAFEQIVVDTGSSDRTVEIAEKLGAKVYHFKWIDDFAAAKNYAIEQASGNWIAFLDADEYLSGEDTKNLCRLLARIQRSPETRSKYLALNCPWVNLDSDGKIIGIFDQERVFRNLPDIRYEGKIHENITVSPENFYRADDIRIMHTGYTNIAIENSGKAERNIKLLRNALESAPDDMNAKAYLADALNAVNDPDKKEEAIRLYAEVLETSKPVSTTHKQRAYKFFISRLMESAEKLKEREELCRRAAEEFPGSLDFKFLFAGVLCDIGEYTQAINELKKCEQMLLSSSALNESTLVVAKPLLLYSRIVQASQGIGDAQGVIKYSTVMLQMDKYQLEILAAYIDTMLSNNVPEDTLISLLERLYDFGNVKDLQFITNAANECGAEAFVKRISSLLTE